MANMINSKAPLSGLAKLMAMKGRDGDTMLAHINPMEAKMLSAMGGRGTPNPSTGLPEYAEDDGDSDDSGGGENSGSSGEDTGSNSSDYGGFGDEGNSVQDWANAAMEQSRPLGSVPVSDVNITGRTTDQIVFDDNFNNPNGSFGNLNHSLNPQGTEFGGGDVSGFGSGLMKTLAMGGLSVLTAGMPVFAALGTKFLGGAGLDYATSEKKNVGNSMLSMVPGTRAINDPDTPYVNEAETGDRSLSNIGPNISNTVEGVWNGAKSGLSNLVDGNYTEGDGSALFGGTAFTPEQNESAFGDSGGSTERKKQMRYVQQRAQAPDATPEEVLRWKQVSNPDYTYTPEAMGTYAERGGPSHFKMVQANTGGGLSDLYNMSEGGTFSGMVKGPDGGDGMSDDVAFNIKDEGQGGPDKALLSKDEYVIDAHSMSLLGNGSSDAGADQMDKFIKDLRKSGFGTTKQPKQLDGAEELSKLL